MHTEVRGATRHSPAERGWSTVPNNVVIGDLLRYWPGPDATVAGMKMASRPRLTAHRLVLLSAF
jgi:hypothetical protein